MPSCLLLSLALLQGAQVPVSSPLAPPANSPPLTVVIPKGTHLKLALCNSLSTRTSFVGQGVTYALAEDVKDSEQHTLIPAGTCVGGQVTAKRGRMDLSHSVGMLAISAEVLVAVAGDDATQVPVHITETDKAHHDYRTKNSLAPPKASAADVAQFKATQAPLVDVLLKSFDSAHGSASLLLNPFSTDGAVLLSRVLNFKGSSQITAQLPQIASAVKSNSAINFARSLHSIKDVTSIVSKFGFVSAFTIIGAGVGLYDLITLVKGLYKHVTITSGTLFDATTTADTTIPVAVSGVSRSRWKKHVTVLRPSIYAHFHNTAIKMQP